jgi:hypothetical protein
MLKGAESHTFFRDEIHPELKHDKMGVVSTVNSGPNFNHYEVTPISA